MEDKDFESLKEQIRRVWERYDRLQKVYKEEVGQRYRWANATKGG